MSGISFLTPLGGLVALAVVLPLAGLALFERRAERVRAILRLPDSSPQARWIMLVSLTLVAAALGIAAAQPVLTSSAPRATRLDAEAYAIFDISRSMEARTKGGASRLDRAKTLALKLRSALPDVPFGVASFATSTLPHLFPIADASTFAATVADAVQIGLPPTSNVYSATQRTTDLAGLSRLSEGYFDHAATHRLAIVFTDGETTKFYPSEIADYFRRPHIQTIFVHVWDPRERIYLTGEKVDPGYRPDPSGGTELQRLAAATDGAAFSEHSAGAILARARADLGSGPTRRLASQPGRTPLSPWALCVAFVPLAVILRRRNL